MARVITLPEMLRPMMGRPSVTLGHCAVCGRAWPLNRHHVVRRGAGRMWLHGIELAKPTMTLCGSGSTSGCHGLAHQNRLHFRWVDRRPNAADGIVSGAGHWEYLLCDEPTRYQDALDMDGWRRICAM